jgi:hypothetical protein
LSKINFDSVFLTTLCFNGSRAARMRQRKPRPSVR